MLSYTLLNAESALERCWKARGSEDEEDGGDANDDTNGDDEIPEDEAKEACLLLTMGRSECVCSVLILLFDTLLNGLITLLVPDWR